MWILFDCRRFPCCWTVIFAVIIFAVVIFAGASDGAVDSVLWIRFDFAPFLLLQPSAADLFFFGSMIRLVVAVAVAVAAVGVGVGVCNEIVI